MSYAPPGNDSLACLLHWPWPKPNFHGEKVVALGISIICTSCYLDLLCALGLRGNVLVLKNVHCWETFSPVVLESLPCPIPRLFSLTGSSPSCWSLRDHTRHHSLSFQLSGQPEVLLWLQPTPPTYATVSQCWHGEGYLLGLLWKSPFFLFFPPFSRASESMSWGSLLTRPSTLGLGDLSENSDVGKIQ